MTAADTSQCLDTIKLAESWKSHSKECLKYSMRHHCEIVYRLCYVLRHLGLSCCFFFFFLDLHEYSAYWGYQACLYLHTGLFIAFLSFTQKHGRKVGHQLLTFSQVQHVFLNRSGQHPNNSKLAVPAADRGRWGKKKKRSLIEQCCAYEQHWMTFFHVCKRAQEYLAPT